MSPLCMETNCSACTGPTNSVRISFQGDPEICWWAIWDATSALWSLLTHLWIKNIKPSWKQKKSSLTSSFWSQATGQDPKAFLCIQMHFLLISSLRGKTPFSLSGCGYVKCFKAISLNDHYWECQLCRADGCRTWESWEIQRTVLSRAFMLSAFSWHWKTQYFTLTLRVLSLCLHNTRAEVLPSWSVKFGSVISLLIHRVSVLHM